MEEVGSIVIVVVAMFAGLALLGWCYGDFQKPQGSSTTKPPTAPSA